MKNQSIVLHTENGLVEFISGDQNPKAGCVVLLESNEIVENLDSKPVLDTVFEMALQVLKRLPNKTVTKKIEVEYALNYGLTFHPSTINEQGEIVRESQNPKLEKFFLQKISDTKLAERAKNCFKAGDLHYCFEILQYPPDEFLKWRNFGRKSLARVQEFLAEEANVSLSKWEDFVTFFKSANFRPQGTLCTEIESIGKSEAWKKICQLLSPFEDVTRLCAEDFNDFSGRGWDSKLADPFNRHAQNNYSKNITDQSVREEITKLIPEIREKVLEFYQIEVKKFVDTIPLD